jgi:drug/metabolite transporter (DMT)-like permease
LLAAPIALGTLFAGLDRSTVLDLTLVGAIGPMVVALGGAVFFKDRITKKEKAGIAIVLLGVFLNSLAPLFRNGSGVVLTGNLLILAFLFADSSSILIAKYAVRHNVKSITLTNFAFIIGAVTLVPTAFLVYGYLGTIEIIMRLPFTYHLGVWYMALVSGSLAYFLYVKAQRSIEVSEAVLFNYLQPVFMIPLAIFWLNETISPSFIFGSVLIIIGIIIAEYKTKSG